MFVTAVSANDNRERATIAKALSAMSLTNKGVSLNAELMRIKNVNTSIECRTSAYSYRGHLGMAGPGEILRSCSYEGLVGRHDQKSIQNADNKHAKSRMTILVSET